MESFRQHTSEQVKNSPYLLCCYANQKSKGKLPKDYHNAMLLHSINDPDDYYVGLYFKYLVKGALINHIGYVEYGVERC